MTHMPTATGLYVCEKVIIEERTRNPTLVSGFSLLRVSRFPSPPRHISVFASLTDGLGEVTMNLVCSRLDTLEEVYSRQSRVTFPDRLQEVHFHYQMQQLVFPVPGLYQFTLCAENELLALRTLNVMPTSKELP